MKTISEILKEAQPKHVDEVVHSERFENKPKLVISAKLQKHKDAGKKIFLYIPVLSAVVIFNNGKQCKFYSYEMRTSISQIRFQDFHPVIDFDYGYQALISMIEGKLKGQYVSALIYKSNNSDEHGILCRLYQKGFLKTMNDPDFNTPAAKAWTRKREDFNKFEIMSCGICVDYSQRKKEMFF